MKLLQQTQPGAPGCVSGSGWSGSQASALSKQGKSLGLLELETERLLKQQAQHQRAQHQRDRVRRDTQPQRTAHVNGLSCQVYSISKQGLIDTSSSFLRRNV